jgi:hypothetical protein
MLKPFVVALLLLVSASAHSQQPTAGTHTPTSDQQRQHEVNERDLTLYTEVLADATVVLVAVAILQACLFLWQLGYMRKGLRDAKTAADAAKDTASAAKTQSEEMARASGFAALQTEATEKLKEIARLEFFASHRPKIEIKFIRLLPFSPSKPPDQQPIAVEFVVVNSGTSEAVVLGSKVALLWLCPEDVPLPNDLIGSDVVPKRSFKVGATDKATIWSDELGGLNMVNQTPRKSLYLLGWVVYVDGRGEEFGDTHTTYFGRVFDRSTMRLEISKEILDWEFIH